MFLGDEGSTLGVKGGRHFLIATGCWGSLWVAVVRQQGSFRGGEGGVGESVPQAALIGSRSIGYALLVFTLWVGITINSLLLLVWLL